MSKPEKFNDFLKIEKKPEPVKTVDQKRDDIRQKTEIWSSVRLDFQEFLKSETKNVLKLNPKGIDMKHDHYLAYRVRFYLILEPLSLN